MTQYKCEQCGYLWEAETPSERDEETSIEYEEEKEEEVVLCPMCGGSYLEI